MNKPIEVGCLVLVTNASQDTSMIGKVFSDTERASDKDYFFGKPAWRLDIPIPNIACEDWLVRIDDYTEETETQEEEMVV